MGVRLRSMSITKPSSPPLSRRSFLARAGTVPAILAAQTAGGGSLLAAAAPESSPVISAGASRPIGIELYSVRNELQHDLPKTLRTVAQIGYKVVEFYAPYFDWSFPYAKEVRSQLDDLGLRCDSTHNGIQSLTPGKTMAKAIELNQILGCRYIVLASAPGRIRGVEGWKRLCEKLTAANARLEPHGLFAGYHNHQAEWAKVDGNQRIMDVIAANTPREFVLQFDVGTCMEAGQDPVAWVKANPGRIKCVHLKDWAPGGGPDAGYRVLFGEGITPWQPLVAALESVGGVEYYLMEQEGSRYSEFETARRCLQAWKALRRKV